MTRASPTTLGIVLLLLAFEASARAAEKVVPVHVPTGRIETPDGPVGHSTAALVTAGEKARLAGRYYEADSLFHRALAVNEGCFQAYEGLAGVAEARSDHGEAVRVLRQGLRFEPFDRVGVVDLEIAQQLAALNRWSESETAARSALNGGAPEFESRYALGLALYKQRRWRPAEEQFHEVERLLPAQPESTRRARSALIHLLLAECEVPLGFPRAAIRDVQAALDTVAAGDAETVRTARKIDDALDQPVRRLKLSLLHEYDTNVLTPYNTTVDLNGGRSLGGGSVLARLTASFQSSPDRRWVYGFELPGSIDTHTAQGLTGLDVWTAAPTVWVSWWNLRTTELKLFYTYGAAYLDRNDLRLFMQTQGPELTWRYFFSKRAELDAGYSFRTIYYPGDAPEAPSNAFEQQSGQEQRAFIRAAFAGPNPSIQPFVQYTFDDNFARGKNRYALINSVEAGLLFWLDEDNDRSRLVFSGTYYHVDFPEFVGARADRDARARAALELAVSKRVAFAFEADYLTSHSSLAGAFSYDRIVVRSGLSLELPF